MTARFRIGMVALVLVLGACTSALANSGEPSSAISDETSPLVCLYDLIAEGSYLWDADSPGFESPEEAVVSYLIYARDPGNIDEFVLERSSSAAADSDVTRINVRTATGVKVQASVVRNPLGGYNLDTTRLCTFLDEERTFYAADQPFINNAFLEDEQ